MGKMNRLLVLLLAVCIAGNACAFANDDEHNIKKEKNIPDEAVIRKNRAHTRTVYVSAESNYTITSTNYPSNYPNNADDIWYLQTDKGRIIQLTFVSFRLESGYDNLKGGDGEDASTAQLFSLSGSAIPTDKVSSGNKMWLRFTSDSSVTYQGFYIVAQSVLMTDSTTEPSYGCSSYQWRCYYNGQCIQDYQRCNGYSDCYYGEDEYNCYVNTVAPTVDVNPPSSVVRLVNGYKQFGGRVEVFIDGSWGTVCDDGWDIRDAEVICRQLGSGPAIYAMGKAAYGQGVGPIHLRLLRCEGWESSLLDCTSDAFPPANCSHSEDAAVLCSGCSSYEWRCYYNDQCIQDYQRCNGYSDCYYGEDEYNCYNEYTMAPPACNDYEWVCHSSHQCIPHDQRCNDNPDCFFGEDESDCNDFSTEPPACTDYEWRCYSDGECIPQYQVCNGYSDCYYGEDESDCNDIFHCADGDEIPMRYTCDRIIDCLYGEDEWQNCYDNEVKRDNIESYPRREQLLSKGQKTDEEDQ